MMLTARDAESLILNLVNPLTAPHDAELVNLWDAVGRVLAVPVVSQLDFPHWDNSAMDGYAVRYADVEGASATTPVTLTIVEEIPAGYPPQQTIAAGQAARIFTGAVMPPGADTVVMQEQTQRQGDRVTIHTTPKPAAFIRRQGVYYHAGETLLPVGQALGAAEIAILAAAQCGQVRVLRRPRVALLSTGDELVGLDQPLQPGQIVDSNRYALLALVLQAGCDPVPMGIVPDQPQALKAAIAQAISAADVVISSGGVSVGDYDYVDRILAELGATIHVRSVAVKPGKPLTVATLAGWDEAQKKVRHSLHPGPVPADLTKAPLPPAFFPRPPASLYFGLPGNPVSALVTFWRFVQPALRKLSGAMPPWQPRYVQAIDRQTLQSDGFR